MKEKTEMFRSGLKVFRIVSGVMLLSEILPFAADILYRLFWDPQNVGIVLNLRHVLSLSFWCLIPGVFSIVLHGFGNKNSLILMAVLGLCLVSGVIVSVRGISGTIQTYRTDPNCGYYVFNEIPDVGLQLVVCLCAVFMSILNPYVYDNSFRIFPSAQRKKVNGVLHLVGSFLLLSGAAAIFILTNGYYSSTAAYLDEMITFAAVLLMAGITSIKVSRGCHSYAAADLYTHLIAVFVMIGNVLHIIIPWKKSGGYFIEGPGDIVYGRIILTLIVTGQFIRYLRCFFQAVMQFRGFLFRRPKRR